MGWIAGFSYTLRHCNKVRVVPGPVPSCVHSFIDSFIHLFIHLFAHSFIHLFGRSLTRSFIPLLDCSIAVCWLGALCPGDWVVNHRAALLELICQWRGRQQTRKHIPHLHGADSEGQKVPGSWVWLLWIRSLGTALQRTEGASRGRGVSGSIWEFCGRSGTLANTPLLPEQPVQRP